MKRPISDCIVVPKALQDPALSAIRIIDRTPTPPRKHHSILTVGLAVATLIAFCITLLSNQMHAALIGP